MISFHLCISAEDGNLGDLSRTMNVIFARGVFGCQPQQQRGQAGARQQPCSGMHAGAAQQGKAGDKSWPWDVSLQHHVA